MVTSLGFIKLPRVLRDIEVALLTDKQMHQHKSFRLGTERALCRNRGGRWWIWHKKPFVNSRSPTMNLTLSAVERAWLATCYSPQPAEKSLAKHAYIPGDCPRVFLHTWGLSPGFLGHSGRQIIGRRGEISGGCSFGRARTAATPIIFKALRRE